VFPAGPRAAGPRSVTPERQESVPLARLPAGGVRVADLETG
jgi:hypothetical protein